MKRWTFLLPCVALILAGCKTASVPGDGGFSHFIGVTNFEAFSQSHDDFGNFVMTSGPIQSLFPWNELVVSWNADAPVGTFLKIEACAVMSAPSGERTRPRVPWPAPPPATSASTNGTPSDDPPSADADRRGRQSEHAGARVLPNPHTTKFYQLATWSPDNQSVPRASVPGQRDADGDVNVDRLILRRPANAAQIRLTLGMTNQLVPQVKFLGLSFCNANVAPPAHPPNRAAWGKIIPTPERSQQSYAGGNGWCSPTSVSMTLARWAAVAQRPDWDLDAPAVAAGVFDQEKKNTGNWSFNTAFPGSLKGMRAYVTRFDDISELEDWIAAGIPVIISARWDLLKDGRPEDLNGHLTVCRGFTETGDLIINDPWTDLSKESVRHIYKRANVTRAWATKHNTVYLIYPEGASIPPDHFGHWVN